MRYVYALLFLQLNPLPMRLKAPYNILAISLVLMILVNASCSKVRTLSSGGSINFSVDTVKFDTVFTAAGSFTYSFLIYNPQGEEITISSVRMQEGVNSYFHLNVDGFVVNNTTGFTSTSGSNTLKIAPHDSMYVFATVDIDPNNTLSPFLITDSFIATLNGKQYILPFTAYGRNAYYMVADSINVLTLWDTMKPYVVIHNFVVGPLGTLNIPARCQVYMHQDASLIGYGTLNLNSNYNSAISNDSIVIQGDRLDRAYFGYVGYPGEWCGIWYLPGSNGTITHTILKNCGGGTSYYNYFTQPAAIQVGNGASLSIDHSIIENSLSLGLLSDSGILTASNCLVNTTGGQALAIEQGGFDSITNCTFANYGTTLVNHANAGTAAILNYFSPDGVTYYYGALNAVMRNCIVYGSLDSEIICDAAPNAAAYLLMDHCLLKMGAVRESFVHFNTCIFNEDPLFKNPGNGDFHLSTGSPAIDSGITVPGIGANLDGVNWESPPNIGCY
jgi:hypothetical protein